MPKNLRKRGSVWHYRIFRGGKEHEGSLQTESLAVARERLEAIRRKLTDRPFGLERHTFDEAVRKFGAEHFKTLKVNSRKRYVVSIANLEPQLKGLTLDMITTARLSEIEQARLARGVTSATVRRDLACLSSLFSRCEEWGWVTSNPVKPYLRSRKMALKEAEPRVNYWTVEEEAKALPMAPPKAQEAIAFAIDTGLRKEEQFSLLWTDVDLADFIGSLRKRDVAVVVWLHVLASPRKTTSVRPRDELWKAIRAIEARGATIFEVNTCRHSATLSERDGMIQDAIEHITSAGRAAASQKNGEKSRGRAPDVIDEGERKRALAVWHDVRFVSNAQAIAAGPKGWTHYRYNKLFGPSGRGQ